MKKKLLFLFAAILLSATTIGLTACSSDDDDADGGGGSNNPLVGTWVATWNLYDEVDRNSDLSDYTWSSSKETLVFNSNGTGTYSSEWKLIKGGTETENYTFNYTILDVENNEGEVHEVITSGPNKGKEKYVPFVIEGKKLTYNGFGSTFIKQ